MHILLKCQILRRCQRHLRRSDTLYRRVIRQVDKQHRTVKGACLPETLDKEIRLLERDSHCSEYNREILIFSKHLCLSCDLCRKLGMRQTGCGEDRQFLSADQSVQSIDCGHSCLNKLFRIASRRRVHRQTVDIHPGIRQDLRSVIYRAAQSVEHTAKHIR